jgi:tRNA 2-selenouridine synthase
MAAEARTAPDRSVVACADALAQLGRFDAVIDVRSPSEFAEDHIPGALNCPVLDDDERAAVGTMHRQRSAFHARRFGAALVARNIATHIETRFADNGPAWRPLVYCWRGGQRSAAMTQVLGSVGWHARRLEGGYRAFRRHVIEALSMLPRRFRFCVICGATGSGKSRLLRELRHAGGQVLDLESLAQHRGSVLGHLPAQPQPSQKLFETRIWWTLKALDSSRFVYVESESRKVGNLRVPEELIERMRSSECVLIDMPIGQRIRLLRDEYRHFESAPDLLLAQLRCLAPLHGHACVDAWCEIARSGDWPELVERLLVEHYDPAYQRSIRRNFVRLSEASRLALPTADSDAFAAAARTLLSTR